MNANQVDSGIPWQRVGTTAIARALAAATVLYAVTAGAIWLANTPSQPQVARDGRVFDAVVTTRLNREVPQPRDPFQTAELELAVAGDGVVSAYRLVHSSGIAKRDRAILEAASRVQMEGLGASPPDAQPRVVSIRFADAP